MIVVAGEHLVDLIVDAAGSVRAVHGGGPFTTARTIGRLGGDVTFLAGCSTDRFGRAARDLLSADGVQTDHLQATDAPTTLALAELDADGAATYRFYLDGTAAPSVVEEALSALLSGPPPEALHIGTLGLVLEPLGTTLEALVRRLPSTTLLMLDVNARPAAIVDPAAFRERVARLLPRVDVVKVSTDDLAFLHPGLDEDAALERVLAAAPGCVLRTAGGASVRVAIGAHRSELAVPRVRVMDSIGAGDIFGGTFLHALLEDERAAQGSPCERACDAHAVEAAARLAIAAASRSVSEAGARPPGAGAAPAGVAAVAR